MLQESFCNKTEIPLTQQANQTRTTLDAGWKDFANLKIFSFFFFALAHRNFFTLVASHQAMQLYLVINVCCTSFIATTALLQHYEAATPY